MCYASTYNCVVTCINGDLDMAALANKTIAGVYNHACSIECTQLSNDLGGGGFGTSMQQYGTIPISIDAIYLLVIGVLLITIGSMLLFRKE